MIGFFPEEGSGGGEDRNPPHIQHITAQEQAAALLEKPIKDYQQLPEAARMEALDELNYAGYINALMQKLDEDSPLHYVLLTISNLGYFGEAQPIDHDRWQAGLEALWAELGDHTRTEEGLAQPNTQAVVLSTIYALAEALPNLMENAAPHPTTWTASKQERLQKIAQSLLGTEVPGYAHLPLADEMKASGTDTKAGSIGSYLEAAHGLEDEMVEGSASYQLVNLLHDLRYRPDQATPNSQDLKAALAEITERREDMQAVLQTPWMADDDLHKKALSVACGIIMDIVEAHQQRRTSSYADLMPDSAKERLSADTSNTNIAEATKALAFRKDMEPYFQFSKKEQEQIQSLRAQARAYDFIYAKLERATRDIATTLGFDMGEGGPRRGTR